MFGCVVGKVLLFLGATRELAALLQSRLLGRGFLGGDCGLLLPGPSGMVVISGVTVSQACVVVVGARTAIAVTFSGEQTAAAAAYSTLFR